MGSGWPSRMFLQETAILKGVKMPNQRKQKSTGSNRAGKADTLYDAQRRRTLAVAGREELRLARERGGLVPVADVQKIAFATGRRVRDAILNIPNRLAPVLAAELDAGKVYDTLMFELRQALEDLASGSNGNGRSEDVRPAPRPRRKDPPPPRHHA